LPGTDHAGGGERKKSFQSALDPVFGI